jgi:hypothetical protein
MHSLPCLSQDSGLVCPASMLAGRVKYFGTLPPLQVAFNALPYTPVSHNNCLACLPASVSLSWSFQWLPFSGTTAPPLSCLESLSPLHIHQTQMSASLKRGPTYFQEFSSYSPCFLDFYDLILDQTE